MPSIVEMQLASSSDLTIERLQSLISYNDFLQRFLIPNKPCIFPVELIQDWNAFKVWRNEAQEGIVEGLHPAFGILKQRYGDHVVPIVVVKLDSNTVDDDDVKDFVGEREEVSLSKAIQRMAEAKKRGKERIYIKDWHLIRQESLLQTTIDQPYQTPFVFADDWMNNGEPKSDDFRFCYAGQKGTNTVIHRDVYTSYSWSTNICGRKLWRMFPPEVKTHLRKFPENRNSELALNVDEMQRLKLNDRLGSISKGKLGFPEWQKAMERCYEIVQEQGETIFVPSDWHHEVINLTDCISLNHNWCNSCNIKSMYESICEEIEKTEEAMIDVREMMQDANPKGWEIEWTETVQKVVCANAGWAWFGFWNMVRYNLVNPPCEQSLRPDLSFVRSQLQPCMEGFVLRHDYNWLDERIKEAVNDCKQIFDIL